MELHRPAAVTGPETGMDGAPGARSDAYLDSLPLNDAVRARLRARLASYPRADRMSALHRLLGHRVADPPPLASLAVRLSWAFGEYQTDVVRDDVQGRPRVATTPPLRRAVMVPQRITRNPLARLWRWLRRWRAARGRLASAGEPGPAAVPGAGRRAHRTAVLRRSVLLLLTICQAAVATYFMGFVLPYNGRHGLEIGILAVYAVLSAWVSAGFWTAMMGFLVLLRGGDRHSISASAAADQPVPAGARTAILIPVYNEAVARVFAGLQATYESLARTGALARFDVFILSDSDDPDTRVAELEAWVALCRRVRGFGRIHYRRRLHRLRRKSGNIADWCRRWGSRYRYMVVLDADSVMSGACLVRLVQMMEANPGCGIIQTAPQTTGRQTLYARVQQFAHRLYGPLFTAGLHFWQLGESHYWGHNAILRVAPFIRHCALAKLPGRGLLGGEILSHDFVEAALMRRAGWNVWLAYDLPGSWEEMPPTLLEELKRDRRWCRGNLQHFRLFFAQGLHPAHRALFMTGVMAYVSAPLWFLFLALSTALLAVHVLAPPPYFTEPGQLFPTWPAWRPEWALILFAVTMAVLLLPKILGVAVVLVKGARFHGGALPTLASTAFELLFSALLAPIRMLFHTGFVLTAVLGFSVRWQSPPREDAETTWSEAMVRHGAGTLLGIGWAGGVYALNPSFLWWLLPVAGSLIVSVPLSVWSSRVRTGNWLRRRRLFLIPEESKPPRELRRLRAALRGGGVRSEGFRRACVHPLTNALVCGAGRPRAWRPDAAEAAQRRLCEAALVHGPAAVPKPQRNQLLSDPVALAELHHLIWTSAQRHADWAPG